MRLPIGLASHFTGILPPPTLLKPSGEAGEAARPAVMQMHLPHTRAPARALTHSIAGNTWTRTVTAHDTERGTLDYPQDLPGLAGYDPTKYPAMAALWDGCNHAKCNQYFLSGKREALDHPAEWFHDVGAGELYFYPPSCAAPPAGSTLEIKARSYGFMYNSLSLDLGFCDLATCISRISRLQSAPR